MLGGITVVGCEAEGVTAEAQIAGGAPFLSSLLSPFTHVLTNEILKPAGFDRTTIMSHIFT